MRLETWSQLPNKMRTKEVRKYYNILIKHSGWFKFKRVMDIFVASIMLFVLALPMVIIAIFIKWDSKGPVFFKQKRVTQYGRIFEIYKFRTMVENAASIGSQVTVNNDVRITKVGKILRRFRMDEFPQVFNIIKGDMTLVGTRPEVIKYVKCYTPQMYATLLLPAGLTSRTSIAYKDEEKLLSNAANADMVYIHDILPVKMKYNLESLKQFGFKEDCSILWATFLSVLKRDAKT